MFQLSHFLFLRRSGFVSVFLVLLLSAISIAAQQPETQSPAPASSTPAPPAKQEAAPQAPKSNDNSELSMHDNPATFKVRVNLVLVRVVVRDGQGKVIPNLRKEDFLLSDNRKSQTISTFSIETPESHATPITPKAATDAGAIEPGTPAKALPQRFVAMMFDDVHLTIQDAVFARDSATRFFGSMTPSDRAAIYTTSGQVTQEFTSDQQLLKKTLNGIIARPPGGPTAHSCPEVNYYQADLIENRRDSQALAVATEEALQCAFSGDTRFVSQARGMAEAEAMHTLTTGDTQTEYAMRHMEDVLRRLSGMPGQRIMMFVSPGFLTTTLHLEMTDMMDRAVRSGIVINTVDARGLFAPEVLGDISDPPIDTLKTAGFKSTYRVQSELAQGDALGEIAEGTGGTWFHNRNDVDEGMRQAGAAPAVSYLLGFSPQNLKFDGRYHLLKVTLANKMKGNIQARRGYFAPRTLKDPAESAKLEIQEAIFSQEEILDLPLELHTQFFKKDAAEAKLAVLSHLDLKSFRFRKAEGRNVDDVTVATAIFDENGNYITGGEKIVQMKLLDSTYDRLSKPGITIKSSFDVKPGSYLVRQVVRDAEGTQMAAKNGAVTIPY